MLNVPKTPACSPDDAFAGLADLTRRMKTLADQGQNQAADDGCLLVFGIVREYAFKLEQMLRDERLRHRPHLPTTPNGD